MLAAPPRRVLFAKDISIFFILGLGSLISIPKRLEDQGLGGVGEAGVGEARVGDIR